jgi:biotin-(acetyl-CoA carboxylase) ligase
VVTLDITVAPTLDVFHQDTVDSTNDWAWRHWHTERPEWPCLFTTHHQTHGRGAGQGRTWQQSHDPAALKPSLAMSLLLPQVSCEWILSRAVPKLVAVSTYHVLKTQWPALPLQLKGINDLYLTHGGSQGKCGGVLVETRWQPGRVVHPVVVGIGLNLHTAPVLAHSSYSAMALAQCLSAEHVAQLKASELAQALTHHLLVTINHTQPATINQQWLACKRGSP